MDFDFDNVCPSTALTSLMNWHMQMARYVGFHSKFLNKNSLKRNL